MCPLPTISVVIPTYGEPKRLHATLTSLAAQDYAVESVQIVVVDDASPSFEDEPFHTATEPFRLMLIHHSVNSGRAAARNTAIRAADGDIVVFLDSDMTVRPDFLRQHALAHAGKERSVVIGNIQYGPHVPANALTKYLDSRGVHRLKSSESVPFNCFVSGNSSVARRFLSHVGVFDEDFTTYGGEDLELGYRFYQHQACFRYAEPAFSNHNHTRPLADICRLMTLYGGHSLVQLNDKHPELATLLHLDFRQKPRYSPSRILFDLSLLPPIYWSVYAVTRALLCLAVPDRVFDYLLWYNRTRAYLSATS